jgi:formamidase
MPRVRIAVGQGEWTCDAEVNVERMETFVEGVGKDWGPTVKLVTFCEYAVTGYDPARLEALAQPIPGPATERLANLAKKSGYYICNGSMLERAADGLRNTSLIFGPDGEIVHKYCKTHPWSQGAETVVEGREFPVTEIPGLGKVGVMICYDGMMPECARALAFNGAEIILWNSMGFHPLRSITAATAAVRAFENACYVVLAAGSGTHVGLGLHGNSMFVNPDGVVTSQVGETATLAIDVIDSNAVRAAREDGVQGICKPLETLAQFSHHYPQYEYMKATVDAV